MPVKKSNYSLVSVNDRVYVIGGFTGPNVPSSSVEEYDPQSDRWTLRKSMPTARGRIGVVVLRGCIYALGGKTGDRLTTDAVEEYDPATDTWAVRHRLSRPLMGHPGPACTLSCERIAEGFSPAARTAELRSNVIPGREILDMAG